MPIGAQTAALAELADRVPTARAILQAGAKAVGAAILLAAFAVAAPPSLALADDTPPPAVIHCARAGVCDRFPGRPWLVEAGSEDDDTYRLAGFATEAEATAAAARETLAETTSK